MQIKTILNHVQKFKSFVYGEVRLLKTSGQPILEVDVHERSNSKVLCADILRQVTTGNANADLSLSRYGESRCSSSMHLAR